MQIERKGAYVWECVRACGSWFRIIMFFVVRSNDSFNFLLGLIKYIAIVIVIIIIMLIVINVSIITILHPATPAMRNTYARQHKVHKPLRLAYCQQGFWGCTYCKQLERLWMRPKARQ